jgi:ferredoxin-type protein NapH
MCGRSAIGDAQLQELSTSRHKIWFLRKAVQVISTVLLLGVSFGIVRSVLALPILLTLGHSDKTAVAALDAIQELLAVPILPWIPVAAFVLFGVLAGRLTCGWICPFGLLQDLIGQLNVRTRDVPLRTHKGSLRVKYMVLGLTLFISGTLGLSLIFGVGAEYKAALGVLARGPFSALSPESTLLGLIPLLARMVFLYFLGVPPVTNPFSWDSIWSRLSTVTWLMGIRLTILIFVVALCFFVMRGWCRYLCPSGAFLAVFSRFSFLGLRRNLLKCNRCGDCMKVCPMLIRITEQPWEKMTDPECIMCLECVDACRLGAIRPTFP